MKKDFLSKQDADKLTQLICNVLDCLEIHFSLGNTHQVIDINTYRNILHKRWNSVNHNVSRCKFEIKNVDAETKIIDFISDKLSEYLYDGLIQTVVPGGPYPGSEIKFFLNQILRVAIGHNIETVISQFNMIGSNDSIPFQYMETFEGLKIESDIEIEKGIKLIPLPLNFSEMPNYLQNDGMLDLRESRYFEGKTLIVVDVSVYPVICKPIMSNSNMSENISDFRSKFQFTLNYDTFPNFYSENYEGYYNFPLAMSLICNTYIKTCASWKVFPEDNIFNLSSQSLGGSCFNSGIDGFSRTKEINFQKDQVKELKNIINKLNTFDKSEIPVLNIIIVRWCKSKENIGLVDKMIDLGVAFDCIVGREKSSFQLGLSISRFLGIDKSERKKLMIILKKMHKWRSDCVHTSQLPIKAGKYPEKTIEEFQDLCRKCILKILDNGKFPDWMDIIHD